MPPKSSGRPRKVAHVSAHAHGKWWNRHDPRTDDLEDISSISTTKHQAILRKVHGSPVPRHPGTLATLSHAEPAHPSGRSQSSATLRNNVGATEHHGGHRCASTYIGTSLSPFNASWEPTLWGRVATYHHPSAPSTTRASQRFRRP